MTIVERLLERQQQQQSVESTVIEGEALEARKRQPGPLHLVKQHELVFRIEQKRIIFKALKF